MSERKRGARRVQISLGLLKDISQLGHEAVQPADVRLPDDAEFIAARVDLKHNMLELLVLSDRFSAVPLEQWEAIPTFVPTFQRAIPPQDLADVEPACAKCHWWVRFECRRVPPVSLGNHERSNTGIAYLAVFPNTHPDQWCGMFEVSRRHATERSAE